MIAEIIGKRVSIKNANLFCGDKNADSITFHSPKSYNGISLVGVPVFVKTKNGLGDCYKKNLTVTETADRLEIAWQLGKEATAVGGNIDCQLSFEKEDGSLVFNTQVFEIFVGDSIPDDSLADSNDSYLMQLQSILMARVQEVDDRCSYSTKSYLFENCEELYEALSSSEDFKTGDIFRITEENCPDLYIKSREESAQNYTFVDTSELVNALSSNGEIQIGKYVIKAVAAHEGGSSLPQASVADVGKILCVNSSGEWEKSALPIYDGSTTDLIAFTIDSTAYYAQSGMTWTEWCGSGYNGGGYSVQSGQDAIICERGAVRLSGQSTNVAPTAVISDSAEYITVGTNNGGAA